MRISRFMTLALALVALVVVGCSQVGSAVPGTGDTANDPAAVQRFIPNLSNAGYTSVEAASIQTALTSISGGASLLTGNPVAAALVAQIDGMITCYRTVGAVDARIYYQSNIANLIQGNAVPSIGALAVINQDRVVNNFLSCALGSAGDGLDSASAVTVCSRSGTVVREGQNISYVYAATDQQLCDLLQTPFN